MQDLPHGDAENAEAIRDSEGAGGPADDTVTMAAAPTVDTPTVATPAVPTPAVPTPAVDTAPVDMPVAGTAWLDTPAVDTPAIDAVPAPLGGMPAGSSAPVGARWRESVAPAVAALRRWIGPRRRPVAWVATALAMLAVIAVLAYSVPGGTTAGAARASALTGRASASPTKAATKPAPAAALELAPADHAGSVPVNTPVTVTAVSSTLDSVTLVDSQGRTVTGEFGSDRRTWRSHGSLDFGTRYTLSAVATKAAAGPASTTGASTTSVTTSDQIKSTSSFTTVRAASLVDAYLDANAYMELSSRSTYGVGQPIVVLFDAPVTNRAAAQAALSVRSTPATVGAWHWFSSTEVHWRPESYWQPGTQVTVSANLYGVYLGGGAYGDMDASDTFTIGASHIAIADDNTNEMKVYINGVLTRTIPVAMGLHTTVTSSNGQVIDLRTHSGVHVVLTHAYVTQMSSASYGLTGPGSYNDPVYWTTKISYDGEYVHAAPWSVAQQGHSDASHGCINVNTANAIWFYNTFIPGDIVDVLNTGLPLPATDGLGDWTLSWAQWLKGSALPA